MKNASYLFIGYILFHLIATYLIGRFIFHFSSSTGYLLVFIIIEVLWALRILIDIQGAVSINTHLLEEASKDKE